MVAPWGNAQPMALGLPAGARSVAPHHQAIASLIALIGRARTALLAGFAAKVCGCLVNGLMPWRALVAGFLITRNFAKPGNVNTPAFFSSAWPTVVSASTMVFTCFLVI